jgi:hypothetical protein
MGDTRAVSILSTAIVQAGTAVGQALRQRHGTRLSAFAFLLDESQKTGRC